MRDTFFFTACGAFMGGVFLRSFFDLGGAGILFVVVMACALMSAWRLVSADPASILIPCALGAVCLAAGMLRMDADLRTRSALHPYESERVMFEGRVVREAEERSSSIHMYVEPIGLPRSSERVLVMIDRFSYAPADIGYGDVFTITGTLERPEAFATDGGRVFDYPGYLRARAVHYVMHDAQIDRLEQGEESLMRMLLQGKRTFEDAIEHAMPQPAAALGEGVLLGVHRALPGDLEDVFRVTGIIHIIVLSGYNIMIIVEWLTYLLSFFFGLRSRMFMGIASVCAFVLLVGASATAVRAGIMASLLLLARGTGRTYAVARALVLAALVMVVVNPFLLVHDPGFQLSFLATIGLILLGPRLEGALSGIPERFGLRTILTATIATQIFVLPLLLYQTGLFSTVSVVVNALVLPVVPMAMLLTFLTGVVGILFAPLSVVVGSAASLSLGYIIRIAETFAAVPFASLSIDVFPFWMTGVLYIALGLALWRMSSYSGSGRDTYDLSSWEIEEEEDDDAKRALCAS